jgi:sporulation protein YlmC with PRC-barrel domain
LRLSELLGTKAQTVSGRSVGRVHDVRARLDDDGGLVVTGLVVGKLGVLERLGIAAFSRSERLRSDDMVPWRDVLEVGPHAVVIREPPPS